MKTRKGDRQSRVPKARFQRRLSLRLSLLAFYREPKSRLSPTLRSYARFLFFFDVSFASPSLSSSFTLDLAALLSSLFFSPPFCSSVVRLFSFCFFFRPDSIRQCLSCSAFSSEGYKGWWRAQMMILWREWSLLFRDRFRMQAHELSTGWSQLQQRGRISPATRNAKANVRKDFRRRFNIAITHLYHLHSNISIHKRSLA